MSEPKCTAMIYDFDGTLARGNLQETSFIPQIGVIWDLKILTFDELLGKLRQLSVFLRAVG